MHWLIIGIVIGAVGLYLAGSARSGRLHVRWYQWLLGLAALVFYLLALQNFMALNDGLEPKLANFALVAFGLPAVVFTILAGVIPMVVGRREAAKGAKGQVRTAQ
jgi:hypothetical protein